MRGSPDQSVRQMASTAIARGVVGYRVPITSSAAPGAYSFFLARVWIVVRIEVRKFTLSSGAPFCRYPLVPELVGLALTIG